MNEPVPKQTISIKETSVLLLISKQHVQTLVRRGEIKGRKLPNGRVQVDRESALKWKHSSTAAERKKRCGAKWRNKMLAFIYGK